MQVIIAGFPVPVETQRLADTLWNVYQLSTCFQFEGSFKKSFSQLFWEKIYRDRWHQKSLSWQYFLRFCLKPLQRGCWNINNFLLCEKSRCGSAVCVSFLCSQNTCGLDAFHIF